MPVSHVTKVFAVKDAKIARLTADATGTAPTYGPSIDVPGIKSVTIGGDVTTAELRGDNQRLDYAAFLAGITVSFEHAKLSLDALNVLLGSAIADAGLAPNQTATMSVKPTDAFGYFRFTAQAVAGDGIGSDVTITLHKCILTEFPELGMAEEDYQTFTVGGEALPILGTGNAWLDVTIRETAVALA